MTVQPSCRSPTAACEVLFQVIEGSRVAISQVVIDGNKPSPTTSIVRAHGHQAGGLLLVPEGRLRRRRLERDMRERLPRLVRRSRDDRLPGRAATRLLSDSRTGKATLRLTVEEGQVYHVGTFDIVGNRRYSTEELDAVLPVRRCRGAAAGSCQPPFNRDAWEAATEKRPGPLRQHRLHLRPGRRRRRAGGSTRTARRSSTCAGASRRARPRRSTGS